MINKRSKIFIAGHNGMVGSACLNLLEKEGFLNIPVTRLGKSMGGFTGGGRTEELGIESGSFES